MCFHIKASENIVCLSSPRPYQEKARVEMGLCVKDLCSSPSHEANAKMCTASGKVTVHPPNSSTGSPCSASMSVTLQRTVLEAS